MLDFKSIERLLLSYLFFLGKYKCLNLEKLQQKRGKTVEIWSSNFQNSNFQILFNDSIFNAAHRRQNIKKRIRVSLRFPLTLFVDTSDGIILVTILKKKSTKNSIQSSAFHVTQKTA